MRQTKSLPTPNEVVQVSLNENALNTPVLRVIQRDRRPQSTLLWSKRLNAGRRPNSLYEEYRAPCAIRVMQGVDYHLRVAFPVRQTKLLPSPNEVVQVSLNE